MALSSDDWARMDQKFTEVNARISNFAERVEDRFNQHSSKINAVSVEAVKAISGHEREHHDPVKKLGFIGLVVGSVTGIIEGVKFFFGGKQS